MDGALHSWPFIPWRHRKLIEGYLDHQDARLRAYAAEIIARDAEARREQAEWEREDAQLYDALAEASALAEAAALDADQDPPLDELGGPANHDVDIRSD